MVTTWEWRGGDVPFVVSTGTKGGVVSEDKNSIERLEKSI